VTYNVTNKTIPVFNSSFNLTELKIDGKDRSDLLTLQGSNLNIITCLASEINLEMRTAPLEYFVNNLSSFTLKPLDSNLYDENAYICALFNVPELGGVEGIPLPIMEALEMGYCTYNVEENSITATDAFLQMLQSEFPYPFCAVLATINEETGEIIFYDTINESSSLPNANITCLASNIEIINNENETSYFIPSEYWVYSPSTFIVSLTDNNISFKDKRFILNIGWGYTILKCSNYNYNEEDNTLDINDIISLILPLYLEVIGIIPIINVLICDYDLETDKITKIYDTVIKSNGVNYPLYSYFFNTLGKHNIEFKMPSWVNNCPIFTETDITSITLPKIITTLPNYAFDGCTSLETFTLPDSITDIGHYAFRGCTSLETFIMPDSVTDISYCVFQNCTSLKEVKLSENITQLNSGGDANEGFFTNCTSLESITLPKNINYIGDNCFGNCSSLKSITLPKNINYIGYECFYNCSSLNSIRCESTTAPELNGISETIFMGIPSTGTLYYPEGSDYSTWIEVLPSGWTAETFVP
jgi:hypothetical protein